MTVLSIAADTNSGVSLTIPLVDLTGTALEMIVEARGVTLRATLDDGLDLVVTGAGQTLKSIVTWYYTQEQSNTLPPGDLPGSSIVFDLFSTVGGFRSKLAAGTISVDGAGELSISSAMASSSASAAATTAVQAAESAAADRQAVAEDRTTVVSSAETVEIAREEVAGNAQAVASAHSEVLAAQTDVDQKTATAISAAATASAAAIATSDDRQAVAANAATASAAATIASSSASQASDAAAATLADRQAVAADKATATTASASASASAVQADAARADAIAAAANTTANLDGGPVFLTEAELLAYAPADRKPATLAVDSGSHKRGNYRRIDGLWVWESDTLPAVDTRVGAYEAAMDPANAWPGVTVADAASDWLWRVDPDGLMTVIRLVEVNPDPTSKTEQMWSKLAAFDMASSVPGVTVVDQNGDWTFHYDVDSPFVVHRLSELAPATVASTDFSAAEIEAMDDKAVARVAAYRQGYDGDVIGPIWDINLTTVLNQSLGRSSEGWPSQLRDIPSSLGLRMFGNCELPASETSQTYDPLGGASVFNPLVGRDYDNNGTRVLTQAEAAALPQGSGAAGASPSLCALWVKRQMHLRRLMAADDGRQWLLTVPGVGGRTMAEFLPTTPGTYWPRYPDMLTKVKAAATALGKSIGLTTLHISQGQADSTAGTSKADFKAGRLAFMTALRSQIASTFGQTEPFAMIEVQPGGPIWGRDNLSIQDAVLELAAENPHYVVATPHHHVPNKSSGHLSVNGYMWLGCKLGQVDFEVTILRRPWPAARLMEARWRGRTVLMSFWMPYPGIQFRNCYMAGTPTMLLHKGISLFDDAGQVPIATNLDGSTTVSVAGLLTLKLTTTRDIVGTLTVKIADKTNSQGIANIFDGDPFVAPLSHVYDAAAGMYGPDNISELIGKPYPMFNACNACQIVATAY